MRSDAVLARAAIESDFGARGRREAVTFVGSQRIADRRDAILDRKTSQKSSLVNPQPVHSPILMILGCAFANVKDQAYLGDRAAQRNQANHGTLLCRQRSSCRN